MSAAIGTRETGAAEGAIRAALSGIPPLEAVALLSRMLAEQAERAQAVPAPAPSLLTEAQTAERLGLAPETLRKMHGEGKGPQVAGFATEALQRRRRLYDPEVVEAFARSRACETPGARLRPPAKRGPRRLAA